MLIGRMLFVERMPLRTFYKRRVSRIVPVFLLFVLLVYGVAALARGPWTWTELLATLTFLRTYVPPQPDVWHTGLPIGHLWSLNVEEHGYVFLSALTLLAAARSRLGWLLAALGATAVAIHLGYYRHEASAPAEYATRTETAAAYPLLAAGYFLVRERFAPRVRPWMPLAAFAVAVVCHWRGLPDWASFLFPPFLLAFTVNHLGQARAGIRAALASAPLRLLGLCSYSVYLWQQPFYQFREFFPQGLALACVLAIGAASFYWFEHPVRTWLNRHW
jgi:peptidoglycan/LPS O-acetylase OafA/YrhL